MRPLALTPGPDALESIVQRGRERRGVPDARLDALSLTTAEAVAYMRVSRQREYNLASQGRLKVPKDASSGPPRHVCYVRRSWFAAHFRREDSTASAHEVAHRTQRVGW